MTQNKSWGKKGESALYILALIDCIERLDTLLFEARNLQVNIIHTLREPGLYLPLRYEEDYIFGQEYADLFLKYKSNQVFADICGDLIDKWMINFPPPKKCNDFWDKLQKTDDDDNVKKLEKRVRITVKKMWFTGTWGEEQRRYYLFLRAIQSLKRNIFYDKTVLCHFATNEAKINVVNGHEDRLKKKYALFMILRRAVLKRSTEYLNRLRDIQYQFSKAMDTGLQDNPRPSIERRRELGIYMNFLSDRCRDLAQDMTILLGHCGVKTIKGRTTILHSWTHNYTSTNAWMTGEMAPFATSYDSRGELAGPSGNKSLEKETFHFVNTNYWMPDRPSLQPIIAHEIGHGIIRKHLGDFRDSAIQNSDDSFTELILMLENAIKDMKSMGLVFDMPDERIFLKEIACDFLGGATKGFSYLYAQFLDTVGFDLEKMLCLVDPELPEIGMIHHVDFRLDWGEGTAPFPDWYFRLYMLTFLIESSHHHDPLDDLDRMLIKGVRKVLDNLYEQLQSSAQADRDSAIIWGNRKALIGRFEEIIKDSPLVKKIREWRKLRSNDHRDRTGNVGKKKMPRHVQRLPDDVITYLREQRKQKMKERFKRGDDEEILNKKFIEIYGKNTTLFSHLYQIPWQSSMMRGLDFIEIAGGPNGKEQVHRFWHDIHFDCALGRDRFTFALDFYYWMTASPAKRLDRSISLVKHYLQHEGGTDENEQINQIHAQVKKWLNEQDDQQDLKSKLVILQAIIAIICEKGVDNVKRATTKDIADKVIIIMSGDKTSKPCSRAYEITKGFCEAIKKHGIKGLADITEPTVICKILNNLSSSFSELRVAEEISGYKLRQLVELLDEIIDKARLHNDPIYPLYSFLSGRETILETSAEKKGSSTPPILKAFHINRAEDPIEKTGYSGGVKHWWSYLLGRISVSGSYARMLESIYPKDTEAAVNNVAKFTQLKSTGCYPQPVSPLPSPSEAKAVHQHSLLGRYDIIQGTMACSMTRCFLPRFVLNGQKASDETQDPEFYLKEKFFSFFVRREVAFPAKIHYESDNPIRLPWTSEKGKRLWAVIAITLQKRSYRLDMLARLLRSQNEIKSNSFNPGCVEKLHFQEEDVAYLTDGWGDILLFLHGPGEIAETAHEENEKKKILTHLYRIAEIQNVLFEDFMTDRTELIPTPFYLNVAAQVRADGIEIESEEDKEKNKVNLKLRIASRVRLMEDRLLWRSNNEFIEHINEQSQKYKCGSPQKNQASKSQDSQTCNLNCSEKDICPGVDNFHISRIPGRLDFHLHFTPTNKNNHCSKFMSNMTDLLDHVCVDRIDTSIGIEYKLSKQKSNQKEES